MLNKKQASRFTYGDQFEPSKTPFVELLELCLTHQPDRMSLQRAIRSKFFEGHGKDPATRDDNSNKMAMNCLLSLNAYKLIQLRNDGKEYAVTELSKR